MLATTIQITNNPPHTTHTNNTTTASWLRRQPPPTQAADAHTVLNVNPTVCSLAPTTKQKQRNVLYPTQKRTHTHHPTAGAANTCRHKKTTNTPTKRPTCCIVPHKTGLPRKEVIQPHLPVRLPCYDFVPIANPTFDHSPRTSRLGHGLRVLPTFVT